MHTVQILTLLLALSAALNTAFAAALTARLAGASLAQAIMTAGRRRRHPHGRLLRRRLRLPLTTRSSAQDQPRLRPASSAPSSLQGAWSLSYIDPMSHS